jgi:hypothetical protein
MKKKSSLFKNIDLKDLFKKIIIILNFIKWELSDIFYRKKKIKK